MDSSLPPKITRPLTGRALKNILACIAQLRREFDMELSELKPIGEQAKYYGELVVAVCGAIGLVWMGVKRAAAVATAASDRLRVKKRKKSLTASAPKISKPVFVSVYFLFWSPLLMAIIYSSHEQYLTAAPWLGGQAALLLLVLLLGRQPLMPFEALLLVYLLTFCGFCVYADSSLRFYALRSEIAGERVKQARENYDNAKAHQRMYELMIQSKESPPRK
jgi:hypothetical protein